MPFIPDSAFGIMYCVALGLAGVITIMGEHKEQRRILWVLIANWLITRTIVSQPLFDSLFHMKQIAWLANDVGATLALAFLCHTRAALACAVLFFIILQFDIAEAFGALDNSPMLAMTDLLGYIILIIMAGAAHGTTGRMAHYWAGSIHRRGDAILTLAARGAISPRSRMHSGSMESHGQQTFSDGG